MSRTLSRTFQKSRGKLRNLGPYFFMQKFEF